MLNAWLLPDFPFNSDCQFGTVVGGVHDEEEFLAAGFHVPPVSGGTREAAAANRYLPSRFLFTAVKLRPPAVANRR